MPEKESLYLSSHVVSTNTNPGIDHYPISTGFVGLGHLLEIFNMLGIGLPTNSTDLHMVDLRSDSPPSPSNLVCISGLEVPKVLVKYFQYRRPWVEMRFVQLPQTKVGEKKLFF